MTATRTESFPLTHPMVDRVARIAGHMGRMNASGVLPFRLAQRRVLAARALSASLAMAGEIISPAQAQALLAGEQPLPPGPAAQTIRYTAAAYTRLETAASCSDLPAAVRALCGSAAPVPSLPLPEHGCHPLLYAGAFLYEWERSASSVASRCTGLLLYSLLLAQWDPALLWLPVQEVFLRQHNAYQAALSADSAAPFIEFTLSALLDVLEQLDEADAAQPEPRIRAAVRWKQIEAFLSHHPLVTNADVRALCGVSSSTASRILADFSAQGRLVPCVQAGRRGFRKP